MGLPEPGAPLPVTLGALLAMPFRRPGFRDLSQIGRGAARLDPS